MAALSLECSVGRGSFAIPCADGAFSYSLALRPSTPVQALAGEHGAVPLMTWVEVSEERPALAPAVPQQARCQP